jgi:hypothetical protein
MSTDCVYVFLMAFRVDNKYFRSLFFRVFTQPWLLVVNQSFGTTFPLSRPASLLNIVPIGSSETSVNKHQSTLRNRCEEQRLHLHGRGSLKSCMENIFLAYLAG